MLKRTEAYRLDDCAPSGPLAQAMSTLSESEDLLSGPLFDVWTDIDFKSDSGTDYQSISSHSSTSSSSNNTSSNNNSSSNSTSTSFSSNTTSGPSASTKAAQHYAAIANMLRDKKSTPLGASTPDQTLASAAPTPTTAPATTTAASPPTPPVYGATRTPTQAIPAVYGATDRLIAGLRQGTSTSTSHASTSSSTSSSFSSCNTDHSRQHPSSRRQLRYSAQTELQIPAPPSIFADYASVPFSQPLPLPSSTNSSSSSTSSSSLSEECTTAPTVEQMRPEVNSFHERMGSKLKAIKVGVDSPPRYKDNYSFASTIGTIAVMGGEQGATATKLAAGEQEEDMFSFSTTSSPFLMSAGLQVGQTCCPTFMSWDLFTQSYPSFWKSAVASFM